METAKNYCSERVEMAIGYAIAAAFCVPLGLMRYDMTDHSGYIRLIREISHDPEHAEQIVQPLLEEQNSADPLKCIKEAYQSLKPRNI